MESEASCVKRLTALHEDILDCVSRKAGITVESLLNHKRDRSLSWPRQLAMYLISRHCRYYEDGYMNTMAIGRLFNGRDHRTVGYALQRVPERLSFPIYGPIAQTPCRHRRGIQTVYKRDCARLQRLHAEVCLELGLEA